jgi:hypothetical protein
VSGVAVGVSTSGAGAATGFAVFTSRGAGITGAGGFAGSALPPGFLTTPRVTGLEVSVSAAADGTFRLR